jgi:hypothetical protein
MSKLDAEAQAGYSSASSAYGGSGGAGANGTPGSDGGGSSPIGGEWIGSGPKYLVTRDPSSLPGGQGGAP